VHGWDNFYVIVGSASAALTGLQFVVFTLVGQMEHVGTTNDVDAFGTPTVVHFAVALLVSAIACAPWPVVRAEAIALAVCGIGGVVYVGVVARRARTARYRPVAEDWIWHVALPFVAYASLAAAPAVVVEESAPSAMFVVGGAALLLVFVGIHNAWDTVTYMVTRRNGSIDPRD
jgi:hypothetical protein